MRTPKPGEVWRHYKGGLYHVVCLALREDDRTQVVVYHKVGDSEKKLWVRPLFEWVQTVDGGRRRYTLEVI